MLANLSPDGHSKNSLIPSEHLLNVSKPFPNSRYLQVSRTAAIGNELAIVPSEPLASITHR